MKSLLTVKQCTTVCAYKALFAQNKSDVNFSGKQGSTVDAY